MNKLLRSLLCGGLLITGNAAQAYSTNNSVIYDSAGQPVQLRGVNWFGFETPNYVVHGLWSRNWKDMIAQMKSVGFNAVRVPVCPGSLQSTTVPNSIDYAQNADLVGKTSVQILDMMLTEFDRQGMYILLDHHRPDCNGGITELWYTGTYSEQAWLNDLTLMANRYKTLPHMLGIDIKNEPHGAATWGTGNVGTDWNTAAEKAATAILTAAPNLLVFVEGIENNPSCSGSFNHWWGGNLEPLNCKPLNIPANRLVLAPHVYGPDVYSQPYFSDATFPNNMPPIWTAHFGQFRTAGYTLAIGETGGKYGHGGVASDKVFQDALISYLINKDITNLFYWSWNPNSGDTGGILQDDWRNVWQDKLTLLSRLWTAQCSDGVDNDTDGKTDYPLDSGCASALDADETDQSTPPPTLPACSDNLDNDGDGKIDLLDPGCTSATDTDETDPLPPPPPPPAACADNIDNDGDGLKDYGSDPGCTSLTDTDEYNAPPPPPTTKTTLPATVSLSADWVTGYCANVTVTNTTSTSVEWVSTLNVPDTITSLWSAVYTKTDNTLTLSGLDWNKILTPGSSANLGYCANRTAPPPPPTGIVTATLTKTSDWTTGYCANVEVKTTSTTAVQWQISLSIQGIINQIWNASYTQTGSTLTAQGLSWNQTVSASSPAQFGFCANR